MFMLVLCVALDCESISGHTQSGDVELNARFTPFLSTWLVAPMTTQEATVDNGVLQQSGVVIERCRCPAHASGTSCSHMWIYPMCPNCSSGLALACIGVLTTVLMLCYDKQQGAAQPIMYL